MNQFINRLFYSEGNISIYRNDQIPYMRFRSASTQQLEKHLIGRHPLETIQLVQHFSKKNGLAHGLVAVQILEKYLQNEVNIAALLIRKMMHNLTMIANHLEHFYFQILPDYLNRNHYHKENNANYFFTFYKTQVDEYDLPINLGKSILENLPKVQTVINDIKFILAALGGKYPVVMNFVPGGISNINLDHRLMIKIIQKMREINKNIQPHFDIVHEFVLAIDDYKTVKNNINHYISLGSEAIAHQYKINDIILPSGILKNQSLQPVNFNLIHKKNQGTLFDTNQDVKNTQASTDIKSVLYDDVVSSSGVLARLLISEKSGILPSASQNLKTILSILNINKLQLNSAAGRLLAATFETHSLLSESFDIVINLPISTSYSIRSPLHFKKQKEVVSFIESTTGSIIHRAIIENNKIVNYKILGGSSWDLAFQDLEDNYGIVLQELNYQKKPSKLDLRRIMNSFKFSALEAIQ